jgi:hypothetical protein
MRRLVSRLAMFAQTVALFVLIDLGLLVWNFDRVAQTIFVRSRRIPLRPKSEADDQVINDAVTLVRRVTRYYYRGRLDCLPRSLSTFYLLRSRGIAVEFLMGVKKFPFAGHAWVEYAQRVIDDSPFRVKRYTVMLREV